MGGVFPAAFSATVSLALLTSPPNCACAADGVDITTAKTASAAVRWGMRFMFFTMRDGSVAAAGWGEVRERK